MHSVLSTFFQGPVSGAEMQKRMALRATCTCGYYKCPSIPSPPFVAERARDKSPTQYLLTLEQMVENDYPIPSYMADLFQKPPGWVETPEPHKPSLLAEKPKSAAKQMVYAIDCEMVYLSQIYDTTKLT